MTFSITTFSIKYLFVTLSIQDTQHTRHSAYKALSIQDTQHTRHSDYKTLSILNTQHTRHSPQQKCHYAECYALLYCYVECPLCQVLLSRLSLTLSVKVKYVVLSVVMLRVVMLSVVSVAQCCSLCQEF